MSRRAKDLCRTGAAGDELLEIKSSTVKINSIASADEPNNQEKRQTDLILLSHTHGGMLSETARNEQVKVNRKR